jgi:diguanylate cyclase (GGDEF)-like protein
MLPETAWEEALKVAERIRKAFEAEAFHPVQNETVNATVSIGVSQYQPKEDSASFLKRVDKAMYTTKQSGRNRVQHL